MFFSVFTVATRFCLYASIDYTGIDCGRYHTEQLDAFECDMARLFWTRPIRMIRDFTVDATRHTAMQHSSCMTRRTFYVGHAAFSRDTPHSHVICRTPMEYVALT